MKASTLLGIAAVAGVAYFLFRKKSTSATGATAESMTPEQKADEILKSGGVDVAVGFSGFAGNGSDNFWKTRKVFN